MGIGGTNEGRSESLDDSAADGLHCRLLGRTGEYEIADPGEDAILPERVRLRADGGFLFVDYSIPLLFPGTMSFAVAPVSDDEAVIRGFGRGMGETVRRVTVNGETMLSYSGYLLRKK